MSSGWLEPAEGLAARVEALVEAGRVPAGLDVAAIEASMARYTAIEPVEEALAPSEAARATDALIDRLAALESDLRRIPAELSDAIKLAMLRTGRQGADPVAVAADAAGGAWRALELARREIEAGPRRVGRPPSRRAALVLDLAGAIERAGGTVDASAGGPLVALVGAVLATAGERVTSVAQVVKSALRLRS
jgi:hypothetical protein